MSKALGTLALWCVVLVGFSAAQEQSKQEYPKVELFGGYSYMHFDREGAESPSLNTTACNALGVTAPCFKVSPHLNGWNASFQYNITRTVGLEADVSGHYGTPLSINSDVLSIANGFGIKGFPPSLRTYSFLGGPVISTRAEGFKPYLHCLAGINHLSTSAIDTGALPGLFPGLPSSVSGSSTSFALAVGGGLDVNLSRRWSLRVAQVDYLLTFHDPNSIANSAINANVVSGIRTHQNNVRLSAGFVYAFGSKSAAPAPHRRAASAPPLEMASEPQAQAAAAPPSGPAPPSPPVPAGQPAPPSQPAPAMPAAPVQRAGVGISGIENPSGGVWITEVAAGSAAARAGLQENDVVLQVGQYAVQTADDLARAVRAYAPGSQVVIKYRYLGTWVRTTKLTVP